MTPVKFTKDGFAVNSMVKAKLPNIRTQISNSAKPPVIDYGKLSWLCGMNDITSKKAATSDLNHETFMEEYKKVFVPQSSVKVYLQQKDERVKDQSQSITSLNTLAVNTSTSQMSLQKLKSSKEHSFDVRDYLPLLHHVKRIEDKKTLQKDSIQALRQMLKKHPFERTALENDAIYSIFFDKMLSLQC
ncbi:hypothetical protein Btru_072405 [Bulinus truncatus]|nr:hypothetical protein Btru_072405 [Bulinus truncatus]